MNSQRPDPDTVRTALELAARAPSVHNSQPWRWRVGPRSLDLFADPTRHLTRTDPDGREFLLSCGTVLHHATVALTAMGWRPRVHRFPDGGDPDHLASLEVRPQRADDLDLTLAAAIARRRTDRRAFSDWPVPWNDIALMGARAARAGVMLRQIDRLPRLAEIVAEAVARHAADPDYLAELAAWSGRRGSVAGVPARNAVSPDPVAAIPARAFAGAAMPQTLAPGVADHAVVVALGTETDDPLARLRAGEATSLVLLSATAMGLASCPVTEPLEIAETRAEVRREVFGDDGNPQMLIRLGWAPTDAEPLPASPRRPLGDVIEWVR